MYQLFRLSLSSQCYLVMVVLIPEDVSNDGSHSNFLNISIVLEGSSEILNIEVWDSQRLNNVCTQKKFQRNGFTYTSSSRFHEIPLINLRRQSTTRPQHFFSIFQENKKKIFSWCLLNTITLAGIPSSFITTIIWFFFLINHRPFNIRDMNRQKKKTR